ncbi:uncharacterized protein LOC117543365 isoform X1 [Gymnodraco acuticeps]|uniref:Uncharacterized protein LOC117543365 isoform X1 n=2 Tax=Gymnodraco acuticeps TaxID=8218 RepID=A0A6P8TTC8_GYMAC|nr:uncharacterized protein LOC117543365 isoform X1 [Gymnodraco acuticeps]
MILIGVILFFPFCHNLTLDIPQMKEDIASLAGRYAATSKQLQPQNTVAAAEPQKKQPGDDDDDGGGDGGNNNKIHGERTEAPEKTEAPETIEIVKGSGVFCKRDAWKASIHTTSGTAMVRTLLLGTFPLETLLQSKLNGGKPKRGDGEQLEALDPGKKAAIIAITGRIRISIRGNNEEVATHKEGPAGYSHQQQADRAQGSPKADKIIDIY